MRGIAGADPLHLERGDDHPPRATSPASMIKGIDPRTVGSVTDLPRVHPAGRQARLARRPASRSPPRTSQPLNDPPARRPARDRTSTSLPARQERRSPPTSSDEPAARAGPDHRTRTEPGSRCCPGIVIGRELAASLQGGGGRPGERGLARWAASWGPQGPMPKSRPFRVAGIFYSGMYEYDSKFVYIQLERGADLLQREGRHRHRAEGRPTSTTRAASPRRSTTRSRATPTAPRTGAR